MKYVDEFRDKKLIDSLAGRIRERVADSDRTYNFMEVCGTHTMAIFRFALRSLLPKNIRLISGPGCPVCVTPNDYLDRAIAIAKLPNVIIATFGDMLRVPGSRSSLEIEKAVGCDIRIVYSTDDALALARRNPDKEIVFLGIGFETTAPTVASSIITAAKEGIANYSVLSAHKTMPEVLEALVRDREIKVDGFLLPGHVSVITGVHPYDFLAKKYRTGAVITGFEPIDILQAILTLIEQKKPRVEIEYKRIVHAGGNPIARKIMAKVFEQSSAKWRGIGEVKKSGLKIRREYSRFDAAKRFDVKVPVAHENKGCICGQVLKGIKAPTECKLFGKVCTPENPVGSCMVSSEGTCAAYYKYGKR